MFAAGVWGCGAPESGGDESPDGTDDLRAESRARADSLVQAWIDEGRIPGAVLSITRGSEPAWEKAYGLAHAFDFGSGLYPNGTTVPVATGVSSLEPLAAPRAMTTGTVFDLASVTKVMATTMAAMILVDEQLLDFDTPVSVHLAEFAEGERAAITPRHLLTHTSGLPQWLPVYYHAASAPEAHRYVASVPLQWPVGAERHYSDLGFMVLGRLVEQVSGLDLDRFVHERVYEPLGLSRTGFRGRLTGSVEFAATSHGNPFERRMVHDSDFGYPIDGDPEAWNGWRQYTLVGEVNDGNAFHAFGGVAGHAGLFSTAAELQRLLSVLVEPTGSDTPLVSRATVADFLREHVEGQALGWQIPNGAPAGSFGHTGFTGTWVFASPSDQLRVVLLTNRQHGGVDGGTRYPDVGPLQNDLMRILTALP